MNQRNKCIKCRHYTQFWCPILAKRIRPDTPVCDYGILCIRSDRVAKRANPDSKKRQGGKNHAPKLKGIRLT